MSEHDPRPVDVRLESAFDRYNRAVMAGLEPTPGLFIEALEAEGLNLSLVVPGAVDTAPVPEPAQPDRQSGAIPVHGTAERLVPRRVRGLF